jgi:hypothetical protein
MSPGKASASSVVPSPGNTLPRAARTLWTIRWKLGELLGWDDPANPGLRRPTLSDRLPEDLRYGPPGPTFDTLPFTSLYLLEGRHRRGHPHGR